MKVLVIGCETIKEELLLTAKKTDFQGDLVWIDGGLHEHPDKLRDEIQSNIDHYDGIYSTILLAYGLCGNSLVGIKAEKSRLIIPKVDDCISWLLGSNCRRKRITETDYPLFMTKGWRRCAQQVNASNFQELTKEYGDETARELYQEMFAGYRFIDIIRTGAYDVDEIKEGIDEYKDILGLPEKIIAGDLALFESFLQKKWERDFVIKQPGEQIEIVDFAGDIF